MRWLFSSLILLTGCTQHLALRSNQDSSQQIAILEEMRIGLVDAKQALNAQKMDLSLLEEKVANLSRPVKNEAEGQIAELERRLNHLEKVQERAIEDLRTLSAHYKETRSALTQIEEMQLKQNERFEEIGKLRGTLTSISKAMNRPEPGPKTHRVKPGDSLEKIARSYHTSIEQIQELNHLSSHKIMVGQELKIP